jgi:O-antigen ligase
LRNGKVNYGLLAMVAFSVLIGVLAGRTTSLTLSSLVRALVLINLLLIGYLLLLRSIVAGMLIYLYSLVFLNYYWRIVIPGIWPDVDLPRMMFLFVWLIFLLELVVGKRHLLPNTASGIAMMALILAIILSMILSSKIAIRQLLNGYVIPFAMFAIAKNVLVDRQRIEKFVLWLSLPLAFYFPFTAIMEHYDVTALIFPRYIGKAMAGDVKVTDWGGRSIGTFLAPASSGFAMIAAYVLALYSLTKLRSKMAVVYAAFLSVVTPIGVFFTYTRSVYMGLLAALVTLAVASRRQRVIALVLLVGMGLAVIGNWSNVTSADRATGGVGEVSTAKTRLVLAQASFAMFLDHPIVGVGFTGFIEAAKPYIARVRTTVLGYKEAWQGASTNQHNQWLSVLTEVGLIGFIPYVLVYYFVLRDLVRARRVAGNTLDRELVVSVWAVMAAYMMGNLFVEPRFCEFHNVLPFMFAGILTGACQRGALARGSDLRAGNNTIGKEYAK